MRQPTPDPFGPAREHRQRLRRLLDEAEKIRAQLGAEIAVLLDHHGLSERAVAAGLDYRSGTSVRRAAQRSRSRAATTTSHAPNREEDGWQIPERPSLRSNDRRA